MLYINLNKPKITQHRWKIFFLLSLLTISSTGFAQQEAMFSRYMFNTLTITPAYAGSHEAMRFSAQARRQWLNIAGSPFTGVLSADWASKDKRAGFGALAAYEKVGLYQTQELHGNYAYRFDMGDGKLALGIRAGATFYQYSATDAILSDRGDLVYAANENFLVPKAGVGLYYQDESFFVGFSVPNLATYRAGRPFTLNDDRSYVRRHYFAHVGFIVEIDKGLMLKPSALVKYVKGAPVQADLNMQMYVNNKIGIGLGYRTGDAMSIMLEFYPSEQLRIGYAYDATFSRLQNAGANAHEIIIGYEIPTRRYSGSRYRMQDIKYF
jgi:type IX secretion system PorP/SprF family membrane protein